MGLAYGLALFLMLRCIGTPYIGSAGASAGAINADNVVDRSADIIFDAIAI
jgi:hypothetical protein